MDLMGSDALQSEEDLRQMWGDSIKAVKGQHARITYDDFLLLMKGQTKDAPSQELERDLSGGINTIVNTIPLQVVPEIESGCDDSRSGMGETVNDGSPDQVKLSMPPYRGSHSAPSTPVRKKPLVDLESPMSMDESDDILSAGPGVPGSSASLTPPQSPTRGATDYITPAGSGRVCIDLKDIKGDKNLVLPSLPASVSRPLPMYSRGRSRSLDEKELEQAEEEKNIIAHAVHDLMLPEVVSTKPEIESLVKDDSKSNLVVNRTLYRAHRQMRLAVLDASKRFEEQQQKHARDVILAVRSENEAQGVIQAGLVMRHGHKKQVSSQAVRALLDRNREQQQAVMEKAIRRGGRGRRSRKKTISDMAGMLSATEDLSVIAQQTAAEEVDDEIPAVANESAQPERTSAPEIATDMEDLSERGQMRGATVPGQFRKTNDPFGTQGKYGAAFALFQGKKRPSN